MQQCYYTQSHIILTDFISSPTHIRYYVRIFQPCVVLYSSNSSSLRPQQSRSPRSIITTAHYCSKIRLWLRKQKLIFFLQNIQDQQQTCLRQKKKKASDYIQACISQSLTHTLTDELQIIKHLIEKQTCLIVSYSLMCLMIAFYTVPTFFYRRAT